MKTHRVRWQLFFYDCFIFASIILLLLYIYKGTDLTYEGKLFQLGISFCSLFGIRFLCGIYSLIWRYGGIQCYIRLLISDFFSFILYSFVDLFLVEGYSITFGNMISIITLNTLFSLALRMMYRYAYKCKNSKTRLGRFLKVLLKIFANPKIAKENDTQIVKTNVAIIGAGRVGVILAEELLNNAYSTYSPCCFVDIDKNKTGRSIFGLPVYYAETLSFEQLREMGVQEVIFAIPNLSEEKRKELFNRYFSRGFKIKSYDYPTVHSVGDKRQLREFDIEDLLFRNPVVMSDELLSSYYKDKVVLITGGGGSIGSELCRQLAKVSPKRIIIVDICENGAYDVQQELKIAYGAKLDLRIEIVSITNKNGMKRVFEAHRPQIVINAAAHKHVPLMENNCIEAVENNVFGTKILIDLCEEYGTSHFMMVSTDKAVNPTNVMGATKRMCEMIVQSASTHNKVKCSLTRFGNVLGSAGSVIPLFKRQIANGGPITITDKRIIRYFMTIPEASQLVLQSGAMSKNGELFVLDMGQPVKILDLAENMIRLSGARDIKIIETGLRPGEKLYEELLIKTEELDQTDNTLIFIERDAPLGKEAIDEKLDILRSACAISDDAVKEALHMVVPTYKTPEAVNSKAEESYEMAIQKKLSIV